MTRVSEGPIGPKKGPIGPLSLAVSGLRVETAERRAAGARVAGWLKARYPRDGAKRLEAELGIANRTAKRWLGGRLPAPAFLARMIDLYGPEFALALAGRPALGLRLEARLDAVIADLVGVRRVLAAAGVTLPAAEAGLGVLAAFEREGW